MHGAFQAANRTHRLEAALAQELAHEVGDKEVVVADEYAAPMPRTTVALHWLTPHLPLGKVAQRYYLHYAGRAGTGMTGKELKRLAGVLKPLQVPKMALAEPPPR